MCDEEEEAGVAQEFFGLEAVISIGRDVALMRGTCAHLLRLLTGKRDHVWQRRD